MNNNTEKNTTLITGATGKLGKKIAKFLASKGWNIILHYFNSQSIAYDLCNEISIYDVEVDVVRADFSQQEDLLSLFERVGKKIDLLINNASLFKNDRAKDLSLENFEQHMKINCTAPSILSHLFSKQLPKDSFGDVVNILDYSMHKTPDNFFSYHSSKAALAYITKLSARQLAPKIKVNGIALGSVIKHCQQSDENFNKFAKSSPLKSFVSVDDILSAIEFIINSKSMTGQIITIDSGMHLSESEY